MRFVLGFLAGTAAFWSIFFAVRLLSRWAHRRRLRKAVEWDARTRARVSDSMYPPAFLAARRDGPPARLRPRCGLAPSPGVTRAPAFVPADASNPSGFLAGLAVGMVLDGPARAEAADRAPAFESGGSSDSGEGGASDSGGSGGNE